MKFIPTQLPTEHANGRHFQVTRTLPKVNDYKENVSQQTYQYITRDVKPSHIKCG